MHIYIPAWQLLHFIRSWWLRDKTWEWPGNKTSIIYKNLLTILCRSSAYCPILTVPRSSRVNAHHAYSRSVELTYVYSYDAVTHFKCHDIQQQSFAHIRPWSSSQRSLLAIQNLHTASCGRLVNGAKGRSSSLAPRPSHPPAGPGIARVILNHAHSYHEDWCHKILGTPMKMGTGVCERLKVSNTMTRLAVDRPNLAVSPQNGTMGQYCNNSA